MTGEYRQCVLCAAPHVTPIPPAWTTSIKYEAGKTVITPHKPNCLHEVLR